MTQIPHTSSAPTKDKLEVEKSNPQTLDKETARVHSYRCHSRQAARDCLGFMRHALMTFHSRKPSSKVSRQVDANYQNIGLCTTEP